MKKVLSTLLSGLLIVVCFSACSNDASESISFEDPNNNHSQIEVDDKEEYLDMSSNLDDFMIKIDNEIYKLPCAIDCFTGNGWEFPEYFDDYDDLLDNDSLNSTKLLNSNNVIDVEIFNYSGNRKAVKDCSIGRVTYDFSGSSKVYLADDYLLNGKSRDEIINKYGTPYSNEEYDSCSEVIYVKTGAEWIYERYVFTFNSDTDIIEEINVVNFIKTETVENNNSNIQYLSDYIAPNNLGDDPLSFNVSIMGDVYNLPAPVKEFINNGWEIVSNCDVGAGSYEYNGLTMSKDGKLATFGVYNFSNFQVQAEDATIYSINQDVVDNTDVELVLPGNIKIGTPKGDVEKIIKNNDAFYKEESEYSISYIVNNRNYMITIWISEDGVVESLSVFNKICSYY